MVVVTGATGHIGNVLVRQLLSRGEIVRAVVPPSEDTSPLKGLKVEVFAADIRHIDPLIQAFKGSDVVYHLAAIISILPGKSELLHQVNVAGTRNVVEACLKTGGQRLVYASSIHALKEPPQGTVIDETCPYDPESVLGDYAKCKARAFVADLVPEEKRGTAYGLYHGVVGLTLLPASLIAGWVWDAVNPAAPFYFGAGLAFLAMLGIMGLVRE